MRTRRLIKTATILLKKKANCVTPEGKREIEERIVELERAISRKAEKQMDKGRVALRKAIARHIPRTRWEVAWDWTYSLTTAVLIALVIRHFVVEPFKIPSGSMDPTLKIGDKILVNKYIYGLRIPFTGIRFLKISKPKRWDVVVFSTRNIFDASQYPKNFVKRVVGLPGETLEILDGKIYKCNPGGEGGEEPEPAEKPEYVPDIHYKDVSGKEQVRLQEWDYAEVLGIRLWKNGRSRQSFRGYWRYGIEGKKFTVPEGHYFVLGDNTDNSFDGRAWGFVPLENIKGKVVCKWSFKPPFGKGLVR